MSLLEELQSRHARLLAQIDEVREEQAELKLEERAVLLELDDVQRAIGALQPPPPEAPVTDEALLDDQPEAASPEFASEPLTAEEDATLFDAEYDKAEADFELPETDAAAERIEDESQAEPVIEQSGIEYYVDGGPVQTTSALIADDIPSIPREEIPIGAAVETYTDSGLETVKISGTTYVVDDEPERQAETQPEAAYAPVNEDEGLMWANGFKADFTAKAEAEQEPEAKRPFWMFRPKVDA